MLVYRVEPPGDLDRQTLARELVDDAEHAIRLSVMGPVSDKVVGPDMVDVISQIGLAIPMMLLYEISIWGALWVEKGRAATEAANAGAGGIEDTDFNQA